MSDESGPPVSGTSHPLTPDSLIKPHNSIAYWNKTPSTVSGMLGGFPQVSRIDVTGSRTFLVKLLRISNPCPSPAPGKKLNLSADTGAGIGRITTSLLAPLSTSVDVIEPITKFTDQLRAEHPALFTSSPPTISRIINTGLESWHPEPNRHYDLVWNQWCLGHLTDAALIAYLRRLRPALSPRGWVVVKENVTGDGKRRRFVAPISNASEDTTTSELGGHDDDIAHEIPLQLGDEDQYDDEDSSVTRSAGKFEYCFAQAGWRVVRTEVQRGFGKELGLFPVRMWGLQPLEEGGDDGDGDGDV